MRRNLQDKILLTALILWGVGIADLFGIVSGVLPYTHVTADVFIASVFGTVVLVGVALFLTLIA